METGNWLTTMPNTINATTLSAEEFRDSLRLRFGLRPLALQPKCDGCGKPFTVAHAMSCKKGGMIFLRHNAVSDEFGAMCAIALSPSAVAAEPQIHTGRAAGAENEIDTSDYPNTRGDLAVRGFWKRGTTAIFDVRVTDPDCYSARAKDHAKILAQHELSLIHI